jgi:hypothetical protein
MTESTQAAAPEGFYATQAETLPKLRIGCGDRWTESRAHRVAAPVDSVVARAGTRRAGGPGWASSVRRARRIFASLATMPVLLFCLCLAAPGRAEPQLLFLDLVQMAGLTTAEVRELRDGALVRELAVSDSSRQIALAGVIRIDSAGTRFAEALAAGQVGRSLAAANAYGRFADPAAPGDVANLRFSESDLEVLPACKLGACKFKLSRPEIDHLQTIDWSSKQSGQEFTRHVRERVLSYVQRYRSEGNTGLIVYADKPQPGSLSATTEAILGRFASFQRHAPQLADYLRRYPEGKTPGMADSIEWSIKDFGYRPTLSVDHLVVDREPGVAGALTLIARKTIYANHYLAGRVQMGAIVDAEEALGAPGRFIVLVDRIDFDDSLNGISRRLLSSALLSDTEQRMETLRRFVDTPP